MSEQAETATSSSTADAAKQEASRVGQQAGQTGQHVASVASDEAGALASQAGQHAQDLLSEAKSSLSQQAASQQSALSSFLRTVADDLHAMVERSSDSRSSDGTDADRSATGAGVAGQAVREVSSRAGQAASWLQDREPADLLDEVTRFARQRPGAFLLAAGVAGLVAGRLTRGLKDDAGDSSSRSSVGNRPASSTSSYVSPEEYAGPSRPVQVPTAAVVDVDDE